MGTIFWDFDGTLVHTRAMWSQAFVDALKGQGFDENGLTVETVRPHLQRGFPWQKPDIPHLELNEPAVWWSCLEERFSAIFEEFGFSRDVALDLAKRTHQNVIQPEVYMPYEEAAKVLRNLRDRGWTHIVLSNHVPELSGIIQKIGLSDFFEKILVSASVGYEKPYPEIFNIAKKSASGDGPLWMVGDNLETDILGAERAGIPGILVHSPNKRHVRQAEDLNQVAVIIGAETGQT